MVSRKYGTGGDHSVEGYFGIDYSPNDKSLEWRIEYKKSGRRN
jgi:hypothetical protein